MVVNENTLKLMSSMNLGKQNEKAPQLIEEIEKKLNFKFPLEYKEFLLKCDGAEGELGKNNYLVLWPLKEIVSLNEEYEASKYTPNLVYFGSDGGEVVYALDKNTTPLSYVELPLDSNKDVTTISKSFDDFIKTLYDY